jgi:hypothetical protein
VWAGICGGLEIDPPHPSPLPQGVEGEREPIFVLFQNLSSAQELPRGKGGKGADLYAFQNLSSAQELPRVKGGKGADLYAFQNLSSAQELPRVEGKGSRSMCFSKPEFD